MRAEENPADGVACGSHHAPAGPTQALPQPSQPKVGHVKDDFLLQMWENDYN